MFSLFDWLMWVVAPIVGGIMAASSFIIAKKPDAEKLIEKVAPYKGFLGVALLVNGLWNAIDFLPDFSPIFEHFKLWAISALVAITGAILVGFLLGMGLIATWIPGEGAAEKKGLEMQKKLAAYEVTVGFIAIAGGALMAICFIKYG